MSRKKISLGVTAFLDILGFGNRVLSAPGREDVEAIARDVRIIQENFDHRAKDPTIREVQSNYKKTVLAFSDSVVVNVPLQSKMTELEGTFDALMSELSGMAFAQAECVNQGLFLRGGVDLGWWYRSGSTLVSQSLTRAYGREGSAIVPVIALTKELQEYLFKHAHRQFYSDNADPVRELFRRFSKKTEHGVVSFWYLDYISIYVQSIGWIQSKQQHREYRLADPVRQEEIMELGYVENVDSWLAHHARMVEDAHQRATDDTVKQKYAWLARYHNSVARKYTAKAVTRCKLK